MTQEVPHEEDEESSKIEVDSKDEPKNMALVKENYSKLQSSISKLGSKLSATLQKQETEFLMAYRTHMRNVQKDFETLRHEIDEKEKAIENNVLVKHIEKERDWYKREALHLDKVLLKLKKRETMLAEKVEELDQDRTWLSNQLKVVMKQKNVLETKLNEIGDDKDGHDQHNLIMNLNQSIK